MTSGNSEPWWKTILQVLAGLTLYVVIKAGIDYWNYNWSWAEKYVDQCERVGKGGLSEIRPGVYKECKF